MKTCRIIFSLLIVLLLSACSTAINTQKATEKEANVNAVTKLSVNEKEQKAYSDIYDYLRSRVPGLLIRGTDISIRGINSVNAQASPLILVDNAEMKDISALNPYEVETVEVIKDAAASIYGFRGAGGVIKITTKGGKKE